MAKAAKTTIDRFVFLGRRLQVFTSAFSLRESLQLFWRQQRSSVQAFSKVWPGYDAPIWLRAGTSDVQTFCHVIADDGYAQDVDDAPAVIIDAGAHIGLATIWYANRYPNARILSLEPNHDNYELLCKNTAAYPNVTAIEAALWTTSGSVRLTDPHQGTWAYRVAEGDAPSAGDDLVASVNVLDLCKTHDIDRVNIFKIDIEGSEKEVFEDADLWIDRVDAIAIELHDRFKPGCSRAFFRATTGFVDAASRGEDTFVRRP